MLDTAPPARHAATASSDDSPTPQPRRTPVAMRTPTRFVLLSGGGIALVAGTWAGLIRADLPIASGPSIDHGVLMTLGFLGTLIALERAVALRTSWGYAAPTLSTCAVVATVFSTPRIVSGMLFVGAGLVLVAIYGQIWRPHHDAHVALMGAGGLAWVVAAAAWTAGVSAVRLAPTLAAFLVLTIIGERLELSRLRQPSAATTRRLFVVVGTFIAGVCIGWAAYTSGLVIAGIGLVATTIWFIRHDIARITVRKAGLPRFAAACMLAGYGWLAVGGILWIALGLRLGGALLFDAAIHAVFLGFVLSMVMGHAPIILPAVLRITLPYRRVAWVPLGLLHVTVAARVIADIAGSTWGRGLTAAGNAAALGLFIAIAIGTALQTRNVHAARSFATPRKAH